MPRASGGPVGYPVAMRPTLLAALLAAACSSALTRPAPPVQGPAPGTASSAWWNGAVVYEVFVRSFQDSNGDGKGDLAGLIARLDYLNDGNPASTTSLGVDAIWLMPIYPSPSYHGYDVTDYQGVNPDYGSLADLDRLVAEAHRRGIKVILDFVPNHSSSQHPWFQDSASSPAAAHRDWYVWQATDPGWTQPWNACGSGSATWHALNGAWFYGVFWSGMPDLNWRNAAVRDAMKSAAAFWLGHGVDGFRIDAVRHLVENGPCDGQVDQPETHAYLKDFSAAMRAIRPDVALVGEAWTSTSAIATYYGSTAAVPGGDELPLLFDFPLSDATVQGVKAGDASAIVSTLLAEQQAYPQGAAAARFLTNHDEVRAATQLGSAARDATAAAVLLTLPGSPFLYYGEELGMQNGATTCSGDVCKRTPMAWDGSATGGFTTGTPWTGLAPGAATANVAAEATDPASLLSRYRALIRARKGSPALSHGDVTPLTTGNPAVLAFLRTGGGETVLVAHNLGAAAAAAGPFAAGGTAAEALFADPGAAAARSGGSWTVTLPAGASGAWRLR